MANKFKLKDRVMWRLHTDKNSINDYEIKATKEQPFDGRESHPFNHVFEVTKGNDYMLSNNTPDGKHHSFQYAKEVDLELIKSN